MSNPVENTKIELISEAIETLVAVTVAGQIRELRGEDARKQYELVREARSALSDSLRELLKPTLRVVGNEQIIIHGSPLNVEALRK